MRILEEAPPARWSRLRLPLRPRSPLVLERGDTGAEGRWRSQGGDKRRGTVARRGIVVRRRIMTRLQFGRRDGSEVDCCGSSSLAIGREVLGGANSVPASRCLGTS